MVGLQRIKSALWSRTLNSLLESSRRCFRGSPSTPTYRQMLVLTAATMACGWLVYGPVGKHLIIGKDHKMNTARMQDCVWYVFCFDSDTFHPTIDGTQNFLRTAQGMISSSASNYSIKKLYCGIIIVAAVAMWISGSSAPVLLKQEEVGLWFTLMVVAYGAMMFASSYVEEEHHFWYLMASAWFWWLGMKYDGGAANAITGDGRSGHSRSHNGLWSIISPAVPLIIMRVSRAWNQTGQKHAGELDIARGWLQAHNFFLWFFVCIVYTVVGKNMRPEGQAPVARWVSSMFAALLSLAAMTFKVAFTMADAPELLRGLPVPQLDILKSPDLTTQARAVFVGILVFCLGVYPSGQMAFSSARPEGAHAKRQKQWLHTRNEPVTAHLESLHAVLTLFLITQSRVTNIPLFALFELQMRAIASMNLSSSELSLTSIILQNTSFFAFGGSNSISSIDLANGYNGVSAYNGVMVGILTFCSNWAGPIWWTFATMILLVRCGSDSYSSLSQFRLLTTWFVAASVLSVMLACTALRTHLFIWSVFSPKYLYVLAWSLGQHLCVNLSTANLFIWLYRS